MTKYPSTYISRSTRYWKASKLTVEYKNSARTDRFRDARSTLMIAKLRKYLSSWHLYFTTKFGPPIFFPKMTQSQATGIPCCLSDERALEVKKSCDLIEVKRWQDSKSINRSDTNDDDDVWTKRHFDKKRRQQRVAAWKEQPSYGTRFEETLSLNETKKKKLVTSFVAARCCFFTFRFRSHRNDVSHLVLVP